MEAIYVVSVVLFLSIQVAELLTSRVYVCLGPGFFVSGGASMTSVLHMNLNGGLDWRSATGRWCPMFAVSFKITKYLESAHLSVPADR